MFRVEVFNSRGVLKDQQRASTDAECEAKAFVASCRARGWRANCYFMQTMTAAFVSGELVPVDSQQHHSKEGHMVAKKPTKRTGTKSTKKPNAPKVARKKATAKK